MKVALGSDKSGFLLKEAIKKYLTEQGIEFEDMGTQDLEHGKPCLLYTSSPAGKTPAVFYPPLQRKQVLRSGYRGLPMTDSSI